MTWGPKESKSGKGQWEHFRETLVNKVPVICDLMTRINYIKQNKKQIIKNMLSS